MEVPDLESLKFSDVETTRSFNCPYECFKKHVRFPQKKAHVSVPNYDAVSRWPAANLVLPLDGSVQVESSLVTMEERRDHEPPV